MAARRDCMLAAYGLCCWLAWVSSGTVSTKLKLLALAIASLGIVFWFFGGPHLGWTKTSIEVWKVDPVTEIKFPEIRKKFIPGIDFLSGVLLAAGSCWAVSFFVRRK